MENTTSQIFYATMFHLFFVKQLPMEEMSLDSFIHSAVPGGFIAYAEEKMTFMPFSIATFISDLERLLNSDMIRTTQNNTNSLLYSSGFLSLYLQTFINMERN